MIKPDNEELIARFREIHGDKYDYSFVESSGYKSPVKVVCPKHGDFFISPYSHITMGKGCPECEEVDKKSVRNREFIKRAQKVHGDKYDYSLVDYVNNSSPVKIICPEHGVFEQKPVNHILRRNGCPKCGKDAFRNTIIQNNRRDFEEKARKVHGGKYDYSLVDYKSYDSPVKIICPEHGVFEQAPSKHLSGYGCEACGRDSFNKRRADKYREIFLKKAREVHGDKYDYSLAEYKNIYSPVKIVCPEHGIFEQCAEDHLRGIGCQQCSLSDRKSNFLEKAGDVHGDRYDYSSVEYVNSYTPVKIICPEHGSFIVTPRAHVQGAGCPECADGERQEAFLKKARDVHGDRYDYSLVKYKSWRTPIQIICPEHGVFEQLMGNHITGGGCPKCAKDALAQVKIRYSAEAFEEKSRKVHGNKYDYSLVEYKGTYVPVRIICPEHGVFEQTPHNHYLGYGCPKCVYHVSKDEQEVYDFVKSFCPDAEQSKRNLMENKMNEVDIWVPSKNIGIEYNGAYYHSTRFRDKYHIKAKNDEADKAGFRLVTIFDDEWQNKRDITESRLKSILGVQEEKIFARKCFIAQITNREARAFLDANHLQGGNAACTFAAGLFYKGSLVSVMTFCRPRMGIGNGKQSPGSYELLKFASRINLNVVGGASRLLKYFIKNTPDASLIYSFADRRWSDGGLYERLGFERAGASKPDYFYIVGGRRYHRFNFRKSVLVAQGFDPSKSEREIMEEREIPRVYDAGNYKYLLKI